MTIYFADGTSQATAGGGKILQVVSSFKNDRTSTTSQSFIDISGLSVSITPSSSSHKVLIMWYLNIGKSVGVGHINLVRDSTAIAQPDGSQSQSSSKQVYHQSHGAHINVAACFLDSPSTTSSTTYKIQVRNEADTTFTVNGWYSGVNYRSASSITVMEVD